MTGRPALFVLSILLVPAAAAAEPLPPGALHRFGSFSGTPVFAFHPSGKSIAIADASGRIDLFDVASHKQLKTLRADGPAVRALEFAPSGATLAIAAGVKLCLLDAGTGVEGRVLSTKTAMGLAFSADGTKMAIRFEAGGTGLYDVTSGRELWRVDHGESVRPGFTADGGGVVVDVPRRGDAPPALELLNAKNGTPGFAIRLMRYNRGPASPLTDLAVAGERNHMATAHADHFVRVWSSHSSSVEHTFTTPRAPDGGILAVALSPDGKWVAAGGGDGALRVWELLTDGEVLSRASPAPISAVRFAPDARMIATASAGSVLLWSPLPDPWAALLPSTAYVGDLSERDSRAAYQAVLVLAARPQEAVPLIRKRLPPHEPATVAKLVAQLGAAQFADREVAERELAALGPDLGGLYGRAIDTAESLEVRQRLRRLAQRAYREGFGLDRFAGRAVQVLELCRTPEALALLREFAAGTPDARMTEGAKAALARLEPRK